MHTSQIEEFRAFAFKAKGFVSSEDARRTESFREFCNNAHRVVLGPLRSQHASIREKLRILVDCFIPESLDLLRLSGHTYREDEYTELIKWVLNGAALSEPWLALMSQKAWLGSLGIGIEISWPGEITTQLFTDDGIPDIVIRFAEMVVVVEAKTGSAEHSTPQGQQQTIAYEGAVRRKLKIPLNQRIVVVFLTTDGAEAANPQAICTTYLAFCRAIAPILSASSLPPAARYALSLLVTHLSTCAVPDGVDVRQLFSSNSNESTELSLERLLDGIQMLKVLTEMLGEDN